MVERKINMPKFLFGDIVVINKNEIGVILKTWRKSSSITYDYEKYNRMTEKIELHSENNIERYRVRHKYLDEIEMEFQWSI